MKVVRQEGNITWIDLEEEELQEDPHADLMMKIISGAAVVILALAWILT